MTRDEIKSARKLRKLSQAALGQLTGLSASEISRIECGYRDVTPAESAAFAAALAPAKQPLGVAAATTSEKSGVLAPKQDAPVNEARPLGLAASQTVQAASAAKAPPVGSDLNDPANFGVLPEAEVLDAAGVDPMAFRARLTAQIARANTILHTPRVPAAVWRAWRQFEQQASALLRGDTPPPVIETPPVVVVTVPVRKPDPVVVAASAASVADADAKGEPKGFTAMFVEVARETLPVEISARISRAAEKARQADQSIGFMKHFRMIADKELDADLIEKIAAEADRRASSSDRSRARRGRGRSSTAAK